MTKQEILNELARLYALQREGKKIKSLINVMEHKLWEECDEELDAEETDEENQKNRKVSNGH